MINKRLFIALITVIIAISSSPALAKKEKAAGGMPPPIVQAVKAKAIEWQPSIDVVGSLQAEQGIVVRPEIAGRVTQILFKSGQYVEKGTPLIQINPDILKAQLDQYQAALVLDKSNYDRSEKLLARKVVSKSAFDAAFSRYKMGQAQVAQAQAQLDQTLIKAPFSGYIGLRQISVGSYVQPAQDIVNLQDTDPIYVDFSVPESYLSDVNKGQSVKITSSAFSGKTYSGLVYALESKVSPNTLMLAMRARVANPNNSLIPGTSVDVSLFVGEAKQVISIPQTALIYSDKGVFVYRVVDGKAVHTPITIINRTPDTVLVSKGLSPGDVVIAAGGEKARNGGPVILASEVAKEEAARAAKAKAKK